MKTIVRCISVAMLALCACTPAPHSDEARTVMVSIEPLRWAAMQVVPDGVQVTTLVPYGGNPETYEPTAMEMMKLSQAEVFFAIGSLGFEVACMERMKQNAPDTKFVTTHTTLHTSHPTPHTHSHCCHDPHVWTSPRGMQSIITAMAHELGTQPDTTATHRADSLCRGIQPGTAFAIYHPSLTSLAQDYGLRQLCIEAEGKEPTPAQLAHTIDQCRQAGVRVVFVQQEFDARSAQQIAQQIGARVVTINPLGYDWPQEIERIVNALKQ